MIELNSQSTQEKTALKSEVEARINKSNTAEKRAAKEIIELN